jgi:hypothetical protein
MNEEILNDDIVILLKELTDHIIDIEKRLKVIEIASQPYTISINVPSGRYGFLPRNDNVI